MDLDPHNEAVLALWQAVYTQWRSAGLGLVGLDYAEVRRWAQEMEIDLSPCVWIKIQALERWELAHAAQAARPPDQPKSAEKRNESRYGDQW